MKTIRIIGGGLAGLSLGVYLRKSGIPVELIEKGSYPRHKVCGEFISGISQETLVTLGIAELFSDALLHHDLHWWMGRDYLLTEKLPEPAMGISRYSLDKRIAETFEQLGGKLTVGKRVSTEQENEEGCVWATGKPVSRNRSHPQWIGLKIHAVNAELKGLHMHSCTSRGKGGYVGLAEVENSRVNCCGLFHVRDDIRPADARKQWDSPAAVIMAYAEACGMKSLLETMQRWEYDAKSFTATAGFSLGLQKSRSGFCLGDSAWLIPPFTGNGMSMAMESSALAAPWLEKYATGTMSWHEAEHGYREGAKEYFSKRMKLSRWMHPMLFRSTGRLALKASSKAGILPFQNIFRQLRTP